MSTKDLNDVLADLGLKSLGNIHDNLHPAQLYEAAIRRREGFLAHMGPLVTRTGSYTGRSPNDKYIVDEPSSKELVWWSKVNRPITEASFDKLYNRACLFLEGRDVFVQDLLVGADPDHELPIKVITHDAWHSLFARTMFIRPEDLGRKLEADEAKFTVLHVPHLLADPAEDGTNSEAFIIVHFGKRQILIGGTPYAGEIKKSIFSVMNFMLPQEKILSMHASANVGEAGDVAILFGLSGTGKTTLSADPKRKLLGDDEHGWGENGVFNLEGGCYAKVINLSQEKEPLIFETTQSFGTILENVGMDFNNRTVNLDDGELTENTRAAYPITHIPNAIYPGIGGHPKNIIMLTCDAFGVLPPISKLTTEQAMYHFLSGYTAKVAGTEAGVTEPQATFSTCFGAPFMSLEPGVYGELLGKKLEEHDVNCWLINTGWSGGPYGVGERMDINLTRTLLNAALSGELAKVPLKEDPIFGLQIPESCEGVDSDVLHPANTWEDKAAYETKARELAKAFRENFKDFESMVSAEVIAAGPKSG